MQQHLDALLLVLFCFFPANLKANDSGSGDAQGREKKHVKLILQLRLGLWINTSDAGGTSTHTPFLTFIF